MTALRLSFVSLGSPLLATSRTSCRRCGAPIWRGARFCVGCGSELLPPRSLAGASPPPWPSDDARAQEDVLPPGARIGEFCVERLLGMGAMGTVYGAVRPGQGERVAIKVIRRDLAAHREARERFLREAEAAVRVRHRNLVDVFAHGELDDQRLFLVMEWLEGETLRARLDRQLSLAEVACVGEQVAHALDALHARHIVHRDLKPDNVFLVRAEDRPRVKVLDLGVAKLLDDDDLEPLTRRGIVIGTAAYSSPEQASGQAVDERSDVYALGVVLFELLAGRRPFEADKPIDLLVEHISRPPPHVASVRPELPRELDRLVLAMMAKDAARRPSLGQVRETLARFADAELLVGQPAGSDPAPPDASSRTTALMALPRLELASDFSARVTLVATRAPHAPRWPGVLRLCLLFLLAWLIR